MEIKGKVVSEEGMPIENARVMILDGPFRWQDMAAVTNSQGMFSLEVEGKGDFQMNIQFKGISKKMYMRPSPNIQTVVIP